MSDHVPATATRACVGKHRHVDRGSAMRQARHGQNGGRRGSGRLEVYRCSQCRGWHVGHPKGQS